MITISAGAVALANFLWLGLSRVDLALPGFGLGIVVLFLAGALVGRLDPDATGWRALMAGAVIGSVVFCVALGILDTVSQDPNGGFLIPAVVELLGIDLLGAGLFGWLGMALGRETRYP